ncbi:MAG: hypothetical protein KU37_00075 [Sulfuricurvum sp. PC08-66]|nr:MAG: hypothetical protein KU37_00075 [Sulfuricurvum sp. PC08-66]
MNLTTLQEAQDAFFRRFPQGFDDPHIQAIVKKHNTPKVSEQFQSLFAPDNFANPELIASNFAKAIGKSSMISVFEKPKTRDAIASMSMEQKDILTIALYELLYGDQEEGFTSLVEALGRYGLAKWSMVTVVPYYVARDRELFVKPTTTKDIIRIFELTDIVYRPTPTYAFYTAYRAHIDEMKRHIDPQFTYDNAGFTGFLMMAMI